MTYAVLLVQVQANPPGETRLKLAERLAHKFDAALIGVSAERYAPMPDLSPASYSDPELPVLASNQIDQELSEARAAFENVCGSAVEGREWRSFIERPGSALVREARAADLVIAAPVAHSADLVERSASVGDLIMGCGRPVLTGPPDAERLEGRRILVAWKNTREARRAIADAMPFLTRADEVLIASAPRTPGEDAEAVLFDVAAWLGRHGVTAATRLLDRPQGAAEAIVRGASDFAADLIVAGGYGHSQLGEWVFGGVTHRLLGHTGRLVLFSH